MVKVKQHSRELYPDMSNWSEYKKHNFVRTKIISIAIQRGFAMDVAKRFADFFLERFPMSAYALDWSYVKEWLIRIGSGTAPYYADRKSKTVLEKYGFQ